MRTGRQLLQAAHHHHAIEDASYFPAFRQAFPKLGSALDLLDNDHRILGAALDETGDALDRVQAQGEQRGLVALAYDRARALEHLINRHLDDEEDVIIPIFLHAR